MAWSNSNTPPGDIARELLNNLIKDNPEDARLLIMKTTEDDGKFRMRMTLKNPEELVMTLVRHAISVGELDATINMCNTLIQIGIIAREQIEEEVQRRAARN
jgi:hypothetical protein